MGLDARELSELEGIALAVAREGGDIVQAGYRSSHHVREKGRADLVTEFDLRSEETIRRALADRTPDMGIVAEEGGGSPGDGASWFCDPLDGTTNFVHGHPFWAVSIGVMEKGRPLVGAVVAPALRLEWAGHEGGEATRNGQPCRVSATAQIGDALVATGFPPNRNRAPENNLDAFSTVIKSARGVRRCGAAAIDCCLVADGTYDAYWERRLNAWDLTAGCAIAIAAGATLSALSGGPADITCGHLLLSNGLLHERVLALLDE